MHPEPDDWTAYGELPIIGATAHRPVHDPNRPQPNELTDDELDWARREWRGLIPLWRDYCGMTGGRSGLALGGDTVWAEEILRAGLDLYADCPGPWQADRWLQDDQARWRDLRAAAGPRLADHWGPHYDVRAFHTRNRAMITGTPDAPTAAFTTCLRPGVRSGGTWGCVQQLRKLRPNMPVWALDPDTCTTTMARLPRAAMF